MHCVTCGSELKFIWMDLGLTPLEYMFLNKEDFGTDADGLFPMKIYVCTKCWLAQKEYVHVNQEIYNENYVSFSSCSSTVTDHAENYFKLIVPKLSLTNSSRVMEIASNDGYLLKNFLNYGIACFGVEPSKEIAQSAEKCGVKTYNDYFSKQFAERLLPTENRQDLIIANQILEHIAEIDDFLEGVKILLSPTGTATFEVPYLLSMVEHCQFDVFFHQHVFYFSLLALIPLFQRNGLDIYDAEEIQMYGGSLRIYVTHKENSAISIAENIDTLISKETKHLLNKKEGYLLFNKKVEDVKRDFTALMRQLAVREKRICAYGASHRATPFLFFMGGETHKLINFIADKSEIKQGRYLPHCHIPIVSEKKLNDYRPDYVLMLPWNLKDEIAAQLQYIKDWGGKFIVALPKIEVF